MFSYKNKWKKVTPLSERTNAWVAKRLVEWRQNKYIEELRSCNRSTPPTYFLLTVFITMLLYDTNNVVPFNYFPRQLIISMGRIDSLTETRTNRPQICDRKTTRKIEKHTLYSKKKYRDIEKKKRINKE